MPAYLSFQTSLRRRSTVASALVGLLTCGSAIAVTIYGRQIAATHGGDPNKPSPVWETHIAASSDTAVAVFIRGTVAAKKVAYAVASYDPNDPNHDPNQPWQWDRDSEQIVRDEGDYGAVFDPSIAYDPTTGTFIVAAVGMYPEDDEKHIVISFYEPNDASPAFGKWKEVAARDDDLPMDKPWLVAGESTTSGREYYIVWFDRPPGEQNRGYAYARSVDGGDTWYWDEIEVNGNRVTGSFCAQPACRQRVHEPNEPVCDPNDPNAPFQGDSMYIAYRHDGDTIRFLKGVDTMGPDPQIDPNDPNAPDPEDPNYWVPLLEFSYLRIEGPVPPGQGPLPPAGSPLEISLVADDMDLSDYVPGTFDVKTTPWLVTDPTDPNRLFAVYQDIADEDYDPNTCVDLDIFVQVLERDGLFWETSMRTRVNQDTEDPNDPNSADQFTPTVIVDDDGNLHVIFYDDRRWPGQSDDAEAEDPKFDVYYAVSTDQGATWADHLLYAADPNDPNDTAAFDTGLCSWGQFGPFEYPGIGYYVDDTREFLLTAFTGTDPNDPHGATRPEVIHSTLIELDPNDPNNP